MQHSLQIQARVAVRLFVLQRAIAITPMSSAARNEYQRIIDNMRAKYGLVRHA